MFHYWLNNYVKLQRSPQRVVVRCLWKQDFHAELYIYIFTLNLFLLVTTLTPAAPHAEENFLQNTQELWRSFLTIWSFLFWIVWMFTRTAMYNPRVRSWGFKEKKKRFLSFSNRYLNILTTVLCKCSAKLQSVLIFSFRVFILYRYLSLGKQKKMLQTFKEKGEITSVHLWLETRRIRSIVLNFWNKFMTEMRGG